VILRRVHEKRRPRWQFPSSGKERRPVEKKAAVLLLQRIDQTPTNAVDERGQQNYIHNDA
jgi:hypothetical protein